jgi:hypothetical protein
MDTDFDAFDALAHRLRDAVPTIAGIEIEGVQLADLQERGAMTLARLAAWQHRQLAGGGGAMGPSGAPAIAAPDGTMPGERPPLGGGVLSLLDPTLVSEFGERAWGRLARGLGVDGADEWVLVVGRRGNVWRLRGWPGGKFAWVPSEPVGLDGSHGEEVGPEAEKNLVGAPRPVSPEEICELIGAAAHFRNQLRQALALHPGATEQDIIEDVQGLVGLSDDAPPDQKILMGAPEPVDFEAAYWRIREILGAAEGEGAEDAAKRRMARLLEVQDQLGSAQDTRQAWKMALRREFGCADGESVGDVALSLRKILSLCRDDDIRASATKLVKRAAILEQDVRAAEGRLEATLAALKERDNQLAGARLELAAESEAHRKTQSKLWAEMDKGRALRDRLKAGLPPEPDQLVEHPGAPAMGADGLEQLRKAVGDEHMGGPRTAFGQVLGQVGDRVEVPDDGGAHDHDLPECPVCGKVPFSAKCPACGYDAKVDEVLDEVAKMRGVSRAEVMRQVAGMEAEVGAYGGMLHLERLARTRASAAAGDAPVDDLLTIVLWRLAEGVRRIVRFEIRRAFDRRDRPGR